MEIYGAGGVNVCKCMYELMKTEGGVVEGKVKREEGIENFSE